MNALEAIPKLVAIMKKAGNVEAQELIMQLREDLTGLREKNIQLSDENKDLKSKLEMSQKLTYEPPYYWLASENEKDGPFCQLCYDKEGKLIRLQTGFENGMWHCNSCVKSYRDASYLPRPLKKPRTGSIA